MISVTPTLTKCRIDVHYVDGEILVSSTGLAKELRWAAHLHGGEQRKRSWAIPATKLHGFVEFCTSRGSTVAPHKRMYSYLKLKAFGMANRYDIMDKLPMWPKLYPFQQSGAQFLATYPRALLLDEMGLGKTVQALMALPPNASGLIVCPASLRLNWKVEGEKWRPDLLFQVCAKPKDIFEYDAPKSMVVMSPECLAKLQETPNGNFSNQSKGNIIVDEAHYYKNPKAKRSQAASWVAERATTCWGLTGTIMTNKPPDVRGVLRTFGLFNAAFATGYYFDNQFGMERDFRTGEITWPTEPAHAAEVTRSIERVAMRRMRSEVLPDLPKKSWATITVDISGAKGADGKRLEIPTESEAFERVYRAIDKTGTKVVPADWSVIGRTRALVAEAKIPAMLEFVSRFVESGTPLVVASFNSAPLHALIELGYPTITGATSSEARQDYVTEFQRGDHPVIGIQLQAGGTGITLTRACHMLMVQRDWSPSVNVQAEDRLVRIGQEHPVIIYDMWANHPLDQRISRALRDKQDRIASTVGRVGDRVLYGEGMVEQLRALAKHIDIETERVQSIRVPHANAQ